MLINAGIHERFSSYTQREKGEKRERMHTEDEILHYGGIFSLGSVTWTAEKGLRIASIGVFAVLHGVVGDTRRAGHGVDCSLLLYLFMRRNRR